MIRLLIVDDLLVVCEGLKTMLASETDIEIVGIAHDGRQAMKLIDTKKPDVVLIDILMPAIVGLAIIRRISQQYPYIQVIVFSRFNRESYIIEAITAGVKGYLLKNLSAKELAASIRFVSRGYSPWSLDIIKRLGRKAAHNNFTTVKSTPVESIFSQLKTPWGKINQINNLWLTQLLRLMVILIMFLIIITGLSLFGIDINHFWSGHGGLLLLMIALTASSISSIWAFPLQHRRVIGLGAFILASIHVIQVLNHSWNWNLNTVTLMSIPHQFGIITGVLALILITPAAMTSSDRIQTALGRSWKPIHLLAVHALVLVIIHMILIGSHYSGGFGLTEDNQLRAFLLSLLGAFILLIRANFFIAPIQKRKFLRAAEESTEHW